MPKLTVDAAQLRLRAVLEDPKALGQLWDVVKAPPDGLDEVLFAEAFTSAFSKTSWYAARHSKRLPARLIRAVLADWASQNPPTFHPLFFTLAVKADLDDAALQAAWAAALQATLDLNTSYAWGSQQRKAKIAGLAGQPTILAALQAAVVAGRGRTQGPGFGLSMDVLAVLAADASEASLDALMAHVERVATVDRGGFDLLELLKTHAQPTPGVDAMFARIAERLKERRQASPALAFAQTLGFGELDDFWFDVWLGSHELTRFRAPRYQLTVAVRTYDSPQSVDDQRQLVITVGTP